MGNPSNNESVSRESSSSESVLLQKNDKRSFGRDVSKLVSGTVIAQIIGFCLYPIITRLFNPEIYGVYTLILSIVSIVTVIGCFRYEVALVLPEKDKDASSLLFACIFILLAVCLLCGVIITIFGSEIGVILNAPEICEYLWIVPVILFVSCFYTALRYWNTRKKRFGMQAATQVSQTLVSSGLQVGLGTVGFISPGSLLYANIFGNLTGTVLLLFSIAKRDIQVLLSGLSLSNIKMQIIRYKKFPLIDSWANLLNNLSWQVPTLLLSAFFSPAVTAFYSLGLMLLQTPMSLIGSSLGQVYFQRGAEEHRNGSLHLLLEDVTEMLLVLSIVPLALLLTMGGSMFGVVFGSDWTEAGVYCQILAVWAFVWFLISTTGGTTFSIVEKQELNMRFSVINLIARVAALVIGGVMHSVYLAIGLFAFAGVITYLYCIYLAFRETRASFIRVLKNSKMMFLFTIVIVGVTIVLNYIFHISGLVLIIISVVICLIYYPTLYRSSSVLRKYFSLPFLGKKSQ